MGKSWRVAVVGTGPAGFFLADALTSDELGVEVDLYERLPVPYGLVRYGIAPDHPRIKNVGKVFDRILSRESVAFFGNVEVGGEVGLDDLRARYDAVCLAHGMAGQRSLGIPGEELAGSLAAPEVVGWYNGHPDFANAAPNLDCETAVVVGNGNVALDVARMLARDPETLVAGSDAPAAVVAHLRASKLRRIVILGRRGPVQNAFGLGDLKEIGETPGCVATVVPEELALAPEDEAELTAEGKTLKQRNFDLLRGYAGNKVGAGEREVAFRFCAGPLAIHGDDRVTGMAIGRNVLTGAAGARRAQATGEQEELSCGLVVRCIGYRGAAMPGAPFDPAASIIPNQDGRVTDGVDGAVIPGLYAAGWIRRGPVGLIGVNKKDSGAVAAAILADLAAGEGSTAPERAATAAWLSTKGPTTTMAGWRAIDAAELAAGEANGRSREKIVDLGAMLRLAGQAE